MITPISQFGSGILSIEGVRHNPTYPADHAIAGSLEKYISTYEELYIMKMFGCDIGRDFISYIKRRDEIEKEERWEELISFINGFDVSPIACYVFYWFVRQRQTQATNVGVTLNKSDNPVVSPNILIVNAWNMMVTINKYVLDFISDKKEYGCVDCDCSLLEPINELGI